LLLFGQPGSSDCTPEAGAAGSTHTSRAGSSHTNDAVGVAASSASNQRAAQVDTSSQHQISGPAAAIFRLLSTAEHSAPPSQQQQQQHDQSDSTEVLLLKQALVKAAQEHQVNTISSCSAGQGFLQLYRVHVCRQNYRSATAEAMQI
jgi:hypothetical protein